MTTTASAPTIRTEQPLARPDGDALLRGYRWKRARGPDGREVSVQVPLDRKDFLSPQEGDVMPESTFHENVTTALRNMLRARYVADPGMAVFHDLIFRWGIPGLDEPSPDIAVVPNVRDREKNRGVFRVPEEGTWPVLVIEVVSPH
ncbi:MAG: Uma2 family endonuclease [Chloroflexi bacterium]|nr:Uma2 family endonuclease [Chloroflexota bacterium]